MIWAKKKHIALKLYPWRNNNRHRKGINPEGLKLVSELVVGEVIMTVNAYEPVTLSEATGNTEHVYESAMYWR